VRWLRLALAALWLFGTDALAAPVRIEAVESVTLTVGDLAHSIAFFTEVLDFEKVSEQDVSGPDIERYWGLFGARARLARLRLGDESIELVEFQAPRGRSFPADTRANDRWFQHVAIIVSDMDRAYERLRRHGVEHVSTAPQRLPDWNPSAGGIEAFYFRDPDRHFLEILAFPEGKGDPRWQRDDALFLGIDHTAIVVDDTEASLAFYRDRLGLEIAGESENHGPEQERLSGVFGARLRITALRAADGPGIELLDYLAPADGRSAPRDARVADLADWRVRLRTRSVGDVWTALRPRGPAFVSPGPVTFGGRPLGFRQGLVLRDRDGHALEVVER
jgi:catechol 2,3-dioxygenase-like lactoylglutathione lyase family enzyme